MTPKRLALTTTLPMEYDMLIYSLSMVFQCLVKPQALRNIVDILVATRWHIALTDTCRYIRTHWHSLITQCFVYISAGCRLSLSMYFINSSDGGISSEDDELSSVASLIKPVASLAVSKETKTINGES